MPHGLTYGRFAFGNFLRRMMNEIICSRYARTAPKTAMFRTIAPAAAPAPSLSAATVSSTTSGMKPITPPTVEGDPGRLALAGQ